MADKEPNIKTDATDLLETDPKGEWWTETKDFEHWFDPDSSGEFETAGDHALPHSAAHPAALSLSSMPDDRLNRIKESHALLQRFSPRELKILLNLKRNTSPKAWTLREDLVVLTFPASNREAAQSLKDRNKEAVKKRLQLLKSKGLTKKLVETGVPPVQS